MFILLIFIFAFSTTVLCDNNNNSSSSGSFYRVRDLTEETHLLKKIKNLRYTVRYESHSGSVECLTRCGDTATVGDGDSDDDNRINKVLMIGSMCYCGVNRKARNKLSNVIGDINGVDARRIVFYKRQNDKVNTVLVLSYILENKCFLFLLRGKQVSYSFFLSKSSTRLQRLLNGKVRRYFSVYF